MSTMANTKQIENRGPAEQSADLNPCDVMLSKMRSLALSAEDIKQRTLLAKGAQFIAGKLAMKGQITIFFAGPNTGKTLISLSLLGSSVGDGLIEEEIFHINLDDDYTGATIKAQLGLQHGFHVITHDKFPKPSENFQELIEGIILAGATPKTILVLDTAKKFADVMDKKAMTEFMNLCRKFSTAGGSIIILAHTNKQKDEDSRVIPGGTSDLLDDCDCAYVLSTAAEEETESGLRRYVKFEQRKSRGPTAREALYSYIVNDEGNYPALFHSVQDESPNSLEQTQKQKVIQQKHQEDDELITAILQVLSSGEQPQTPLIKSVQELINSSRNQIIKCLERWAIPKSDGGLWQSRKGDKNATLYSSY